MHQQGANTTPVHKQPVANTVTEKKGIESSLEVIDNRPEAAFQRKIKQSINASSSIKKIENTQLMVNQKISSQEQLVKSKSYPVQRILTKGDGGQEYDSFQRLLNEFSPEIREFILSDRELASLFQGWVEDQGQAYSISNVMNALEQALGRMPTQEDAKDIRYDPSIRKWIVPDNIEIWDAFIDAIRKSQGRMRMTYEEFEARALAKAERAEASRGPIDIMNEGQLRALWGGSRALDKHERVAVISRMFTEVGYQVTDAEESSRSSSDTPPMLFDILRHPMISKFEIHPGGGIHKAPYIRISTNRGMIKIINVNSNPPYDRLDENGVIYIEVNV